MLAKGFSVPVSGKWVDIIDVFGTRIHTHTRTHTPAAVHYGFYSVCVCVCVIIQSHTWTTGQNMEAGDS